MDFLSQAYLYKHDWWRYVLNVVSSVLLIVGLYVFLPSLFIVICGIFGHIEFANNIMNNAHTYLLPAWQNAVIDFLPYCFLFIGFMLSFKLVHKGKWIWLINVFSQFRWNRIGAAIVLYLLISLVSLPFFFGELEEMEATFAFNAAEFFPYLLVLFLMLPIQVLAEEVIFRSYFGQMSALIFRHLIIPVVLTAMIFAFAHYGDMQHAESYAVLFTAIGISGLTYAIIMVLDNGLEICIGIHFINNLISFVMYKVDGLSGLFEISPEYQVGWFALLTKLVYSIIVLLVFTKLYHWDWRKLFQKIERPALVADEAQ